MKTFFSSFKEIVLKKDTNGQIGLTEMTLRRVLDQSQKTEISSFYMSIPLTKSVVTLSLWKLRLELLDQQESKKNIFSGYQQNKRFEFIFLTS